MKKMLEDDLQILDLWQSPNGNLFLKIDSEFSVVLGPAECLGEVDPREKNEMYPSRRLIPKNNVTPVVKVGRLCLIGKTIKDTSKSRITKEDLYEKNLR